MRSYRTKSRAYRRRTKNNKKSNKRLTKMRRKSGRKTRKQKAGNANLITAAIATAALGAGFYYNRNRKRINKEERDKEYLEDLDPIFQDNSPVP